jgi:hypothetical protein
MSGICAANHTSQSVSRQLFLETAMLNAGTVTQLGGIGRVESRGGVVEWFSIRLEKEDEKEDERARL